MPRLEFQKREGKYSRLIRVRNGADEALDIPNQAVLPHDLFHVAVERSLARRGFAHRYADGEGHGYRMTHCVDAEAVERLVEVMQADSWSNRPDPEEVVALFVITCEARGDTPFHVTAEDIGAIRAEIDAVRARWDALAPGEILAIDL